MSRLKDMLIDKLDKNYSFEEAEEILLKANKKIKIEPPEYDAKED